MYHRTSSLQRYFRSGGIALLAFLLTAVILAGCGSDSSNASNAAESGLDTSTPAEASTPAAAEVKEETPVARVVTDELGHEIALPANPARVYAPYMEDSLLSLGVKPVAQWGNGKVGQEYLQDQLKDVPMVDFSGGLPPSPEEVMAIEPDLIILHNSYYAENGVYEKYSKIAPTYVFNNAAGDLENSLKKLGDLLGRSTEADQALQAYHQKIVDAKAKLAPVVEGKKAALINFNGKGMFFIGGNYFGGYVLTHELGIGKIKLLETENSLDVSLEVLPDVDADYIFTVNYEGTGTPRIKELTESNVWKSMPAVKSGKVYEVSDKYWTGSGLIAYGKIIDDVVEILAP